MNKLTLWIVAGLFVPFLAAPVFADSDSDSDSEAAVSVLEAKHEIRTNRLASNDAIAAQDADTLADFWSDDIQVTISSGTHFDGKAAYKGAFEFVFQNTPGITFVRSPTEIEINEAGDIGSERGRWTGVTPGTTVTTSGGTYQAYWRLIDGQWLITAELFVPLEGSP